MRAAGAKLPREAVDAKLVSLVSAGAIVLGVLLSGFVLREPAPYELYMAGLIAVWAVTGLRLSRGVMPLLVLLMLFNIGGWISMTQMAELYNTPLYLAVSLFLAFTAIFFAAVVEAQPHLYRLIFLSWSCAAIVTALLGIMGYFNAFPGAAMFTRYARATGGFEDPNVFGPFLALPGIYMLHRLLTGSIRQSIIAALGLTVIATGIFLSFSRGAWGLFAVTSVVLGGALFLQSGSGRFRLRIALVGALAVLLLVTTVIVVLQIPGVSDMFSERARLLQYYDAGRLGRFSRFGLGLEMATESPLGIGPLMFGRLLGEDTHNIWLKALMDYGWLGFAAYLTLIVWTVAAGFRILFRDRPWQPYLLCAYVVLIGHIALGTVIDTDHWRHFYLLLGLVWGGIALEYRWQWNAHRGDAISVDRQRHISIVRAGSERSAAR